MASIRRSPTQLELWAGIECTVARVGDRYVDQLELSGHRERSDDLELFAELGIAALRYPVLWETVAATGDWSAPDRALARLRELGIRPVVGLVHHGSGPPHTSLLDPGFAAGLAEHARAVAERYAWVEAWTPVNEPLTTGRFSALYGHWYPHVRDDCAFVRALLTQCRAVVLAMREIRRSNPAACLVQTDDLGKTVSTRPLAYQAEFENERRWLTFDLLNGRVSAEHPLWGWLVDVVDERELRWFEENPCPPDVVGINHYLSSERFLDHRLELYPPDSHGGNGRDEYADVLAARVVAEGPAGPEALLREAWERYRTPLAVTELHNGCTREEQLRWVDEVWRAARTLRGEGVPVEAVTAWSLLGAFDWRLMLTRIDGDYEPGVFDLRAPEPRPTALATAFKALAHDGTWAHPVLETPGWWRRDERLWYEPVSVPENRRAGPARRRARPLLVVGGRGTLGRALAAACRERGLEHRLVVREQIDVEDPESVAAGLDALRPWAVVNAAGYVRVDDAELDADACFRSNADGAANLASACAARGLGLATFSSDLVFDGVLARPYVESDAPAPLSVYGRSKLEGERRVAAAHDGALVVRTSAFFGPDPYNFVTVALTALEAGEPFHAAEDVTISPTYVPDLVEAALDLFLDGVSGVWHLANDGAATWAGLARAAAALVGADEALVVGVPIGELGLVAPRPLNSALASERGWVMRPLDDALARYAAARGRRLTGAAAGSRS